MDKKRKRTAYVHEHTQARSVATNPLNNRINDVHRVPPPASPEKVKQRRDNFDALMAGGGDDTYDYGRPGIVPEGPAAIQIQKKPKAKRYENSDHPVKSWIPSRDACLDGLLRLKGRGSWWTLGCTVCGEAQPAWRCQDCFGNRLLCMSCVVKKHQDEPLHILEEWEDGFFHPRSTQYLKLRFQIGHFRGEECPYAALSRMNDFVVLDNNGIHTIDLDFCSCRGAPSEVDQLANIGWFAATEKSPSTAATLSLLRRFHKLNLQARVPAYDFYNTLVLLTNSSGLLKLPYRLPQFMNMIREYRHVGMCKQAGRGHSPDGIAGTQPGELAVDCRPCPHPLINLPEGWESAPPEIAWIYRLLLSEDANFKLKGRDRSSRVKDPTLGPGWAYMVASDEYLRHLIKFIKEDEISHCVSFAALWSANNKRAKGLRASGVGSVSCSRHEMFRPRGTGDLQKGERYCNMDYLFFSSVIGITLMTIVASYDIACQWSRNFWARHAALPSHLKLPTWLKVIFKVPKFHLPPHVKPCHAPYSFNYTKGVGRTDGEGVERNWSWLNWAARSVSVMGPGAREDTIDDLCGFSNWKKTVDLGNSLLRKMIIAIPNAMIHSRAFHAFTAGLHDGHEEELVDWERMVRSWESNSECENPYEYAEVEGDTMADVMQRISEEDHARVEKNGAAALQVKPAAFVIAGIEIEMDQAAVTLEAKRRNRTTIQATTLQRQRTLLLGKISKLRDVQDTYMPGLRQWLAKREMPVGNSAKPETMALFLPSGVPMADREDLCVPGLAAQEEELRNAQAGEALKDLRSALRTRTFAHAFKRRLPESQGTYTRSRTLTDSIEDRVRDAASRYRVARAALVSLRGPGEWEKDLRELVHTDLRGMNERLLNEEEKEENKKARLLAGLPADGVDLDEFGEPVELTALFNLETGEGKRLLSWIWYTRVGAEQAADGKLHPDIRVEWVKARARADRWREEVILVDEEMRRTLKYCEWKARWWEARVNPRRDSSRADITPELAEGLRAYALAQISREKAWLATWTMKWGAVRGRAQSILRDHLTDVADEVFVPIVVELDDEDDQAAYEDDGFDEEED